MHKPRKVGAEKCGRATQCGRILPLYACNKWTLTQQWPTFAGIESYFAYCGCQSLASFVKKYINAKKVEIIMPDDNYSDCSIGRFIRSFILYFLAEILSMNLIGDMNFQLKTGSAIICNILNSECSTAFSVFTFTRECKYWRVGAHSLWFDLKSKFCRFESHAKSNSFALSCKQMDLFCSLKSFRVNLCRN